MTNIIGNYTIRNYLSAIGLEFYGRFFILTIYSHNRKVDRFLCSCDLQYHWREWYLESPYRTPIISLLEEFEKFLKRNWKTAEVNIDRNKMDSIFMIQELR